LLDNQFLMTEKRTCLDCGEIIKGRADKKFCSDLCRNNYNNKLNADSTNYVRNINNILRKNRRIIEELVPNGKANVSKSKLIEKGFDFTYYTNTYKTQKGDVYFFCYEFGYRSLEKEFFLLVKKNENK